MVTSLPHGSTRDRPKSGHFTCSRERTDHVLPTGLTRSLDASGSTTYASPNAMRHRVIHLINPKTDSLTTRPLYLNRALYSPLAGLLAVAAGIPRDRYEVVLTDENIESIDFDLKADLVGISAMTSYVNRGYQIADSFRARGVPVVMGGVHPSFMAPEALTHCDAVVVGEAELVMDKLLDDLRHGQMRGIYKSQTLHSMVGLAAPRYDLLK